MITNPIEWPNGARCAAAITFDIDADSLIHVARPTDGFDRLAPISMGRYGPTVAVPRILATYRRLGLRQTFFMPAWCMQTYPDTVEAILKDGHEIGHHSWLHENPASHSDAEQGYWFDRATDLHVRMTGRAPRGYRAPVYNVTQGVLDRLIDRGFAYDSSLMADDMPYVMETARGSLIEMPVHWGNDDWPPFAHYEEIGYLMPVRAPSAGLAPFFEEFEAQYEAGGFWVGIWHPFLTGRLARWRVVERWLEGVLARDDVWFAPLEEIAAHVAAQRAAGAPVRVERLPYYDRPQHLG
ncbi:MAG: ribulose phosphate epimerase [Alphaproteobacteria bacterium HGW-Alphaproteobacteria-2]|nr:MAG: ribulose phosphate epimerase [Alphaproteobacteria bacterium HGW-Alphaproteobacteria-2]